MKKFISLLTALVLLVGALPMNALAGENFDSLMKLEKLTYVKSLSGMEEGAPAWHEGMGISASMNAGQVEEALSSLLEDTLRPALRQAEDLYAHAIQQGQDPQSVSDIKAFVTEIRLLEDTVDACLDTVNYQRGYIFYQSDYLKDGVYTTEREKERVAYSVLTGLEKLEAAIALAAEKYDEWLAKAKQYHVTVFPSSEIGDPLLLQTSGLQAQIVKMRTSRMNDLASAAKILTKNEATNEQDIVVDVVTVEEVRVYVRIGKREYVPGAKVWMWKNGDKQGEPQITNEEGYVSFPTASFSPDEDANIDIGYEIQLDGYRTHYAAPNWHLGGDIIYATMEKNVEGEDTYIAGISLNGRDALWSERTLYITPKNDANQTLTVELRSQSTGGAPAEGASLTMEFETENGRDSRQVSVAPGQAQANFIDLWCQKLLPGQSSAFTFTFNNANSSLSMPLTTQKAMTQEPQYIKNAQVLTYFAIPGISTTIPGNVPILGGSNLTLNLPFPEFTAYFNIDGDWMIGFGNSGANLNKKLDNMLGKWKTADQRDFEKTVADYAKETGKTAKEASKDVMRMASDRQTNLILGSVQSFWSINGMAGGHVAPGKDTKNTSTVLISFMVGVKGTYHRIIFCPTPVPIPFEVELGFSVAGGALVKTTATYVGPPVPEVPVLPMIAFQEWKFNSFDVDLLISISLTISCGIGTGIRGTKYLRLGAGVRGTAMTTIQVPLLPSSVRQDDFSFNFLGKASLYVDILFLTMTFDLIKGSITYEDHKWGDWETKFFWDNSKMSAFEGANKAMLLAAGNADDPYFPDIPETEGEFKADHSFRGEAEWKYTRYSDGSKPCYFTLTHGRDAKQSVFSVWVEDEKTVRTARLETYEGSYYSTLKLPDEVQRALDLGAWKVLSVRAAANPEIQEVEVAQWVSTHTEHMQVGAISVVCATEWETQEVELTDGLTTVMEVPTKTTVVSMLVAAQEETNDCLQILDFYDNGERRPAVFVIPLDYGITDVMPMPVNVLLKQPPQAGTMEDLVCVVPEGRWDRDYYIMHVGTDASDGESCYFIQHDDEEKDVAMRWLPYESRPVKMIVSGGGLEPVDFILTEDGTLNTFSGSRIDDVVYPLEKIMDFTIVPTRTVRNQSTDITIFCLVEEEDGVRLKGVTTTLNNSGTLGLMNVTDYDVQINANAIFSGELLGEDYVYWFEQATVGTEVSQETIEEPVTLVKAFCYAPARNLTTDPFTMGMLVGSDGEAPAGYDFASQPIVAQAVPARNAIMMTKEWLKESADGQTASYNDTHYTTYEIDTAKQIINEIVGAISENPAVTAGRSGNIEFTVANQGNTPIVGFDMDVFWLKNETERKRIETVHVDLLDPTKNYVIHMEDDVDSALSSNGGGYTQEGADGIRRIDGLFDTDNADSWNVTRTSAVANAADTEFISLPVLMPTGVHTYLLSYNVPATWSGKHRLEIGIVKAYIPLKVSSLFDTPASAQMLSDTGNSLVLAVSGNPDSENALLSIAGTVRSFNPVSEAQMIIGAAGQAEMMKRLGITNMKYEGGNTEMVFDTAELNTSYRLFEDNGETYVTFTVQREGETDNQATRGVTVSAWLPGESSPTFRHTFRTPMTGRNVAYHITLPVSKLTRGQLVDLVYVGVNDTVDGNEEITDYNNFKKLVLNQGLKITLQPAPVTVYAGEDASFKAEAAGGKAPYAYQWQQQQNGVWRDIPGAQGAALTLSKVPFDWNGTMVRCVVTDASRGKAVSDPALLTVLRKDVPVTGDHMPLTELTVLSVCLLLALILLKKHHKPARR